jgi:hypothetical protein
MRKESEANRAALQGERLIQAAQMHAAEIRTEQIQNTQARALQAQNEGAKKVQHEQTIANHLREQTLRERVQMERVQQEQALELRTEEERIETERYENEREEAASRIARQKRLKRKRAARLKAELAARKLMIQIAEAALNAEEEEELDEAVEGAVRSLKTPRRRVLVKKQPQAVKGSAEVPLRRTPPRHARGLPQKPIVPASSSHAPDLQLAAKAVSRAELYRKHRRQ